MKINNLLLISNQIPDAQDHYRPRPYSGGHRYSNTSPLGSHPTYNEYAPSYHTYDGPAHDDDYDAEAQPHSG